MKSILLILFGISKISAFSFEKLPFVSHNIRSMKFDQDLMLFSKHLRPNVSLYIRTTLVY